MQKTLSQEFKDQLLAMAAQHRELDEFAKGTYFQEKGGKFRACSIGCTIRDINKLTGSSHYAGDHTALAKTLLGSEDLAFIPRLADSIFEGLPDPLHIQWTERWLSAIPAGADSCALKLVLPRFLLRLMDRLPATGEADVVAAIKGVKEVLTKWIDTGSPDLAAARAAAWAAEAARAAAEAAWEAAEAAARAATLAAEAARAAAWAATLAAWAAWEAAWAAEAAAEAAWEAAEAAARAATLAAEAARAAAWAAAWADIADDLIAELEAAQEVVEP